MTQAQSNSFFANIWKFFTSVRLTVVLLLTLAVTSIIGTVVPQNERLEDYFHQYGEFWYRVFLALDIYDLYHSWWFQLLLILLTINIIVCSWERLPSVWKIVNIKEPVFRAAKFQNPGAKAELTVSDSPEEVRTTYETHISKQFTYTNTTTDENGIHIYSEKGRWTRLGVYIVHASIILLLVGGLIGSMFGFEGFVNIPEGEATDHIRLRKVEGFYHLGFKVQCDDFDVSFYKTGAPKEYRSTLTILENEKPVLKRDIIVNDPLRYKGINFFQSSYGMMPPEEVTLNITSSSSQMVYPVTAKIGETFDLPEQMGKFMLKSFERSFSFGRSNLGDTFIGMIDPDTDHATEIAIPIRFAAFDKMRRGDFMVSVGDYEKRYFTGLQVTRDPGVWVVYTGFIMMIIGFFITFFMSHQQVYVHVQKEKDKTLVNVMGTANKNKIGMKLEIRKLSERLDGYFKA